MNKILHTLHEIIFGFGFDYKRKYYVYNTSPIEIYFYETRLYWWKFSICYYHGGSNTFYKPVEK